MDPSVSSIVQQFDPRLAAVLGWVVLAVKVIVDWVRVVKALPNWAPPAIACFAAIVLILLLMLALGIAPSSQLVAQSFLLGFVATVLAMGTTALQARTQTSTDTTKRADTIAGKVADQVSATVATTHEDQARAIAREIVSEIRQQTNTPSGRT